MNKIITIIFVFLKITLISVLAQSSETALTNETISSTELEISDFEPQSLPSPAAPQSGSYPGTLDIPKNKLKLSGSALLGEQLFSELLESNVPLEIAIYDEMPSTNKGKILDVDIARKLFPPFSDGTRGSSEFSVATHVPASQFINYDLNAKIAKIGGEKANPVMIFLAGGGGSGKGTIVKLFPNIYDNVDLILDGTLANFTKASNRIQLALEHGFKVTVIYVFRPIELAVKGIIDRAIKNGRGVPIVVAAEDHYDAQQTVLKLSEDEALKGKIKIIVINNSRGYNDAQEVQDIHDLPLYESRDLVIFEAIGAYLGYIESREISKELKTVLEANMAEFMAAKAPAFMAQKVQQSN